MRIEPLISVSPPKSGDSWLSAFYHAIDRLYQKLATAFNGNVSFGDGSSTDNMAGTWATVVSVAGSFTITHNLGRIPVGYLVVKSNAFENLRFISSTITTLTLAGQNGGATLTIFVL